MRFASITQERFNSYFYGRTPYVQLFSTELEWLVFESGDVTLLATMIRCEIDKDFNAVILGRDLRRKFRAIDIIASKNSRNDLLAELDSHIDNLVASHVDGLFPQGDDVHGPFALFTHRLPPEKRNHYLQLLTEDPDYFPARVIMEELAYWFEDPDGTFIRAMQGNEFNSRLFELYLHAMFYELDFQFDRTHAQPDYLLSKGGNTVAVEAVTVAEMDDASGRGAVMNKEELEKLQLHVELEMPFRFARTLRKKVGHRPEPAKLAYWELPHTKGHPFVIAVHDYSRTLSMSFSEPALRGLLYGVAIHDGKIIQIERHENEGKTISSNFFDHEDNRYVSAILLATQATLPKFNRMGRIAGLRSPTTFAFVHGIRTNEEGAPRPFEALVEHPQYKEFWHEGVFLYHNPNAVTRLDPSLFPHVVHVSMDNEGMLEYMPPNYTLTSTTQMIRLDPGEVERFWQEMDQRHKADAATTNIQTP